jgi:hypothetical protein
MGGPCTLRLQVDAPSRFSRLGASVRIAASLATDDNGRLGTTISNPGPPLASRREYLSAKSELSLVALRGSAANNVVKNPFTNNNPITSPHQSCPRARAQRPRTTATRATPVVSSAKSSAPQSLSSSTLASSTRVGSHVLSHSRFDHGLSLSFTTESLSLYRVHFHLHSYIIILLVS